MSSAYSFLFILVTIATKMIGSVKLQNDEIQRLHVLPKGWSSFCRLNRTMVLTEVYMKISCDVNANDTWSLLDFRDWSVRLDNKSYVLLDIECGEGGRICLPWPYRAHHLHSLKVRNCVNYCHHLEFTQTDLVESFPDSLHVYEGYDVTIEALVSVFLLLDVKTQPPAIECGPQLVKTYISRGLRHKYVVDALPSFNDTDTLTTQVTDMNFVKHICNYVNTEVYDISRRVNASVNTLFAILDNSRFPKLRTLNLSSCEYRTFPPLLQIWRRRLPTLETLDLSHNNISRFEGLRDLSLSGQKMGTIDLTYNNIRTVDSQEIISIKHMNETFLDIRNNPFECNCAMANFSEFLQQSESPIEAKLVKEYSYLWNLTCVSPPSFKGKLIAELSREMLCSPDVRLYLAQISVLSVVCVLLLVVIVVLARYRREIRILAFTRLQVILPCHPVEPTSQKRYDAFVAYSHMDSSWVVKTLLPRLESGPDCSFRLCLHERDFEVGAAIADNIVQSVEASRHTILVLSRKFLESEWCLMEFRTAFHQSLIEKKKHLILVLLEDIPSRDLDPDLRVCMQTWTYIHVSDKLFWDRIVYALTDKSQFKWGLFNRKNSVEMADEAQEKSSDSVLQKI